MSVFFIFAAICFNMIVIIGADGFLGGCVAERLQDVAAWNVFSKADVVPFSDTEAFFRFLPAHYHEVEWVIYCDKRIPNAALSVFRYEIVQKLWTVAARYSVPLLYAFYQSVELSESDFHPDRFVLWTGCQYQKPPFWYIFRLGEVYGQEEDVAGETISRVCAFYRQIVALGEIVLPESERETEHAVVMRDYMYVQDAVRVFYWFLQHRPANGVYDLGSGFERTDLAVVNAIFRALKRPPQIRYTLSHPEEFTGKPDFFLPDLRDLRRIGYRKPFFTVEKGVKSFLRKPLLGKKNSVD